MPAPLRELHSRATCLNDLVPTDRHRGHYLQEFACNQPNDVGSGYPRCVLLGSTAIALAGTAISATAATGDKFPRLGMISTGGPQRYASLLRAMPPTNVVIIGGGYGRVAMLKKCFAMLGERR